jgi:hypothetical protein
MNLKINKTTLIFFFFIAVVIILLAPYFLIFRNGFSYDSGDWADFGTYVGGVLTPLTILSALWTIAQNEKTRDEEFRRIVSEASKADPLIYR